MLPSAGQTFARYRIIEQMGRGGMGVVFRAQDTELGRGVALKFLPADFSSDARAVARLRREAMAASSLNHPNVCTIFDIDHHEGQQFIAMELLEGQTLHQRIAGGPLPVGTAVNLALQIAAGLAAAHEKGIVHRDIKPSNLFITTDGRAKILDFGLAKVTLLQDRAGQPVDSATLTIEPQITGTGAVMGTPPYMSPEQALGEEVDARTDIFSFGAVLHEMLTGALCFPGPTVAATFDAILNMPPASLRALNRQVPDELESIVGKALEKDRRLRYQSASDLRSDLARLQRAMDGISTFDLDRVPHRHGWKTHAWNIVRRYRVAAAATIGLSLVLAVGLVTIEPWRAQVENPGAPLNAGSNPVVAVLPFENASPDPADAYFAQGLHQEVISQLGIIQTMTVIDRSSILRFVGRGAAAGDIATQLGAGYVLRGSVKKESTSIRFDVQLADAGTDAPLWSDYVEYDFSKASLPVMQSNVARGVAAALNVRIDSDVRARLSNRPTENATAYALYLQALTLQTASDEADNATAVKLLEQAIKLDPQFSAAVAHLAFVHWERYHELSGPRAFAESALDLARQSIALNPKLPAGYEVLGLALLAQGRLSQSAEEFTKFLELQPNDGGTLRVLGWVQFLRGRLAESGRLWTDSRAIMPLNPTVYQNLGALYGTMGDDEGADHWRQRAVDIGPNDPFVAYIPVMRAIREKRGRDALKEAERLLGVYPRRPHSMEMAGRAAIAAGDYALARNYYEQFRRTSPDNWTYWGLTYRTSYAHVLMKVGERARARELLAETLQDAMRRRDEGDERPGILREIAAIHAAQGSPEQASEWFKRAVDSGWRHEVLHPSPLFEEVRNDASFRQSLDRMQAEIRRAREQLEREKIGPQS